MVVEREEIGLLLQCQRWRRLLSGRDLGCCYGEVVADNDERCCWREQGSGGCGDSM